MQRNALFIRAAALALCSTIVVLGGCGDKPETVNNTPAAAPAPPPYDDTVQGYIADYLDTAEAFLAGADGSSPSFALVQGAEQMLTLAEQVVPAYSQRKPHCSEMLAAALQIKTRWQTNTAEQLEEDFHEEKGLPANEKTADCHHMKDMVTHPAIALAMLQQPEPKMSAVRHEIEEVAVHARLVAVGK